MGAARQGFPVYVSSDGNTLISGAYADNSSTGAAWVFTRTDGVWSQQGDKLVGTGAVGAASQGRVVSLSSDGDTAIIGGYSDNSNAGAAWVFTRTDGVWSQQGDKLVGTGGVGALFLTLGGGLSLSADGNKAIVGGEGDNSFVGATWVFTRTDGVWSQQGSKFIGADVVGAAQQGDYTRLSDDGSTLLVSGSGDNAGFGAVWVFVFTPVLTSISPTQITAGDSSFTLTATGADFLPGSVINWNGTPLSTTYISSTELTAIVPSSNIDIANPANITVANNGLNGGTSDPQIFTINPAPVQSSGSRPRPKTPKTTVSTPEVVPTPNETTCPIGDKYSATTGQPCTTFTSSTNLEQTPPLNTCLITLTLRQGNTGEQVKCLQSKINITPDGIFGPITKAAVIVFQKAHSLTADGIVGPLTRSEINK